MRKESLGVIAVVSLFASLSPATIPSASGKAAAVEKSCIQLAHAGSQERPIGSVQMCLGKQAEKKAKRKFQSALENKWGFEFDAAAFARIRTLVLHEKHQPATSAGILPLGTFSLSWREQGKVTDDEYTLDPAKSCAFLDQLAKTASGNEYGEFVHVVLDLKTRVRCPAGTSPR